MNAHTLISTNATPGRRPTRREHFARSAVLRRLERIDEGELVLVEGGEQSVFGRTTDAFPVRATVHVTDPRFYTTLALGGSVGAGEAYMDGHWHCDDLTALVRVLARNLDVVDQIDSGWARVSEPARRVYHWLRRNTRRGSQGNIAAHYDLGNELFALFLDDAMMYSSAVFPDAGLTLEEAQRKKMDLICRKLALRPGEHLLEIGTGWGGFAIHAAGRYGCRVTTTTVSREQYELARSRVHEAGLSDRVTVLRRDYRDLEGRFDKLASIEMIEAVGHQYYETFFSRCSALLQPEGMMLLQAIVMPDQRYPVARDSVDFIKRYVFPGSCIPAVGVLLDAVARASDLRAFHLEDIGPHYATTLRLWRERFLSNRERVRALGYPERFVRMWELYLAYCEGGFTERRIGDVQLLLTKPLCRRPSVLSA